MRLCSRNRPTMLVTSMLSLTPGTPGRRQQIPRTINSIFTPACDAWYSARIMRLSTSAFILKIRCPALPFARVLDLAVDQCLEARRAGSRGATSSLR